MNRDRHHFTIYNKGGDTITNYKIRDTSCCENINHKYENNRYCEFIIKNEYLEDVGKDENDLKKWVKFISDNTLFKLDYIGKDIINENKVIKIGIDYGEIPSGTIALGAAVTLRYIYSAKFPDYDKLIYKLHRENPNESVLQCILYAGYLNKHHHGYYGHIPGTEGIGIPVTDNELEERMTNLENDNGIFSTFCSDHIVTNEGVFNFTKHSHEVLCNKFSELDNNITEFRKYLLSKINSDFPFVETLGISKQDYINTSLDCNEKYKGKILGGIYTNITPRYIKADNGFFKKIIYIAETKNGKINKFIGNSVKECDMINIDNVTEI
jgi:hypothetical protein